MHFSLKKVLKHSMAVKSKFINYCVCIVFSSVVACTCNPATLEAKFRNRVGSIPAGGNSPLIGGWIV